MIWIPDVEYILKLFEEKIEKPTLMHKVRLQTTLDKVQWGIPYQPPPTIWDRVTILYKEIIEGHYFADGNKRIGFLIAYYFLEKNGYIFNATNDEAYETILQVAQELKTYEDLKEWFRVNSSEK